MKDYKMPYFLLFEADSPCKKKIADDKKEEREKKSHLFPF
jgi:hypothetical protein